LENGQASSTAPQNADAIRVMIVDDSAVVRGLVTRMLEGDSGIQVVASVGNGQMALSSLERNDVDVILLDIEMPVMDGLTAIPKLLSIDPGVQIIMSSTLTLKGADVTMRAMEAGAADYIPKPTATREISGGTDFRQDLISKVRAWGAVRRRQPRKTPTRGLGTPGRNWASTSTQAKTDGQGGTAGRSSAQTFGHSAGHTGPVVLRPAATEVPEIIAIGSSTGGPQALFTVLGAIKPGAIPQPILITQHMPATFTTILGEHISRISGWKAAEAQDGEVIRPNRIYIAPGDFHMVVESRGVEKVLRINKNPPENFCRPAVDPMLRSLSAAYGKRVLAVILTGMGSDGLRGGQTLTAAGGTVIAQDEPSSVVWGMPGAAATGGICSAVLPLAEISGYIQKMATRR